MDSAATSPPSSPNFNRFIKRSFLSACTALVEHARNRWPPTGSHADPSTSAKHHTLYHEYVAMGFREDGAGSLRGRCRLERTAGFVAELSWSAEAGGAGQRAARGEIPHTSRRAHTANSAKLVPKLVP